MITLLAATDKNGLIGNCGKLPWNIPEDMDFFKKVTKDQIVVMGRKTYISIGKPLKGRVNIILSNSVLETYDDSKDLQEFKSDVIVFNDVQKMLNSTQGKDIIVIGGRSIYKQFLENFIPDRLLISRIDGEFDGNEYLTDLPKEYKLSQWFRISNRVVVEDFRK